MNLYFLQYPSGIAPEGHDVERSAISNRIQENMRGLLRFETRNESHFGYQIVSDLDPDALASRLFAGLDQDAQACLWLVSNQSVSPKDLPA